MDNLKNKYSDFTKSESENKALALGLKINEAVMELQKMGIVFHDTNELHVLGYHALIDDNKYSLGFDPLVIINRVRTMGI